MALVWDKQVMDEVASAFCLTYFVFGTICLLCSHCDNINLNGLFHIGIGWPLQVPGEWVTTEATWNKSLAAVDEKLAHANGLLTCPDTIHIAWF